MWIGREETTRAVQETLRNSHRRDEHPIGPGLRDHRVRLHTVQNFFPLKRGLLHLLRCDGAAQHLVHRLELLLKLFVFLFQLGQLHTSIFVFPKRRDRTGDLLRIHLRQKICLDDYNIAVKTRGDLLIEHQHQAGRIRADLVFGHVHAIDNRYALQIRGNLFECVPLGRLRRETDRIFSGIAVAHAMFALGINDSRFCTCRRCDGEIGNDDEKAQNKKTNPAKSHMEAQRRWLESTGHRVPFSPVSGR